MNRLEELIQELCPNGVNFRKIGDFCEIKTGRGITNKDTISDGKYPVISGGLEPMGFYNEYNREAGTVTIARAGSAGFVNYINTKFYLNDKCFSIIPYDMTNTKFLYYSLKNIEKVIVAMKSTGSVPTVNTEKISSIQVSIPPLEVQSEIVRILDNFTLLTAELTAELTARKEQYEYYRDLLLSFNNEVEYFTLEEISNGIFSGKNKERNENGIFPIYGSTGIIGKTNIWIYEQEQILIARVGANAGFIHIANGKYDVSDNTLILDVKKDFSLKYIYYLLEKENLHKYAKGGGQPLVTAGELKKIKIPVPSLEEQQRIVGILDKFDAYCSDITQGLPAEIELRKQQYEYYRNKLLTFKEL